MYYIQYFNGTTKESEACGDRAVVILDGRNSLQTMKNEAIEFNGYRRPVYSAYQIFKGETFTRSQSITGIIPINNPR